MSKAKDRDAVLQELEKISEGSMADGEVIAKNTGLDDRFVMRVIDYLDRVGFIEFHGMAQLKFVFYWTLEGEIFAEKGGFQYEEAIAQMNVEKLQVEIESLYGKISDDKYQKLMGYAQTIIGVLGLAKR